MSNQLDKVAVLQLIDFAISAAATQGLLSIVSGDECGARIAMGCATMYRVTKASLESGDFDFDAPELAEPAHQQQAVLFVHDEYTPHTIVDCDVDLDSDDEAPATSRSFHG